MIKSWNPNETTKREFAQKMKEIDIFCEQHHITHNQNITGDSYYFELNGLVYRVANYSVKSNHVSNVFGEQIALTQPIENQADIYIHASKTRIIEIYNKLKEGKTLDGRGNVK